MERRSLNFLKLGILFLFLSFNVGGIDLMPDFVGVLLLFGSIVSHDAPTETENRLKPLLLLLAADYFLHWVIHFDNPVEKLIASVISVYTIFMLMGEVIKRIQPKQPDRAVQLDFTRKAVVFFSTVNFLLSAYENSVLNGVLVVVSLTIFVALMVIVCMVKPMEVSV